LEDFGTDGYYRIVSQGSGLGVRVDDKSQTWGAKVIQGQNDGASNEAWCFSDTGNGNYNIIAQHSGQGLSVSSHYINKDGAKVIQWPLSISWGRSNQWRLLPMAPSFWEGPFSLPIVPAAAANFPDGRIITWGGNQEDATDMNTPQTYTSVFDPLTGTATDTLVQSTDHTMFCPGTVFLSDGTVMVSGGTSNKAVSLFDPSTNSWSKGSKMTIPRGYHSSKSIVYC
jgi:galactose oxidase